MRRLIPGPRIKLSMPKFTDIYEDEEYSDGDMDVMNVQEPLHEISQVSEQQPDDIQNKVSNYSAQKYGRYPSVNMRNLSLSPPVFETRVCIDESKGLYGVGLGGSQKESERYALEQLSRVIDLFSGASQTPQTIVPQASVATAATKENIKSDDCLNHDVASLRNEAWYENPKLHVNSIFQKHIKRGPDVQTWQDEFGEFVTVVNMNCASQAVCGRGKAPTVKDSTRFAAIDFLRRYHKTSPVTPSTSLQIQPSAVGKVATGPVFTQFEQDHQYSKEPWGDAPKAELHNIFISRFKRPPFYDSKTGDDNVWYSSVEYDASKGLIGFGKGNTKADSTKNAAIDLVLKLSNTNSSVQVAERALPAPSQEIKPTVKPDIGKKSGPSSKKTTVNVTKELFQSSKATVEPTVSSNLSSQPLRDAGTDADFIKFAADEFKVSYPLIDVWSVGPPHSPEWYCRIQLKTPRGQVEATTNAEVQKKKALGDIMVLFSEKLRKAEPELWSKFKLSGDGMATGKYAKIRGDDDLALYRNMKNAVSLEKPYEITSVDWEHADFALTVSSKSVPEMDKLLQGKENLSLLASDLKMHLAAKAVLPFSLPLNIPFNKPPSANLINLDENCRVHLVASVNPGESMMAVCRVKLDKLPGDYLVIAGSDFQSKILATQTAAYLEEELGNHVGYYASNRNYVAASSGPSLIFASPLGALSLLKSMPFSGALINISSIANEEFSLIALYEAKRLLDHNQLTNLFVIHSYKELTKLVEYMKTPCAQYDLRCKNSTPKLEFLSIDSQETLDWMLIKPKTPEIAPVSDVIAQVACADETTVVIMSSWEAVMQLQKQMVFEDPKRIGYSDRSKFEIVGLHEGLQAQEWISFSERLTDRPATGVRRIILSTVVIFGLTIPCPVHTVIHAGVSMNFSGLENGLEFTPKFDHDIYSASARGRYVILLSEGVWKKFIPDVRSVSYGPEEFVLLCKSLSSAKQAEAVELVESAPWTDMDLREAERNLKEASVLYESGELTFTGQYLFENFCAPCGLSLVSAKTLLYGILFCSLDSTMTCVCIRELFGSEGLSVSPSPTKSEVAEYSDHVSNLIRFNEWKNSRPSFFTEKQELDYCRQKGIDLQRLQRVERFRNQLFQRLGGAFRFVSEFIATGLGKNPSEVVNENNTKMWLIRGIVGATAANSKNVALVSSAVRPFDFYTIQGEHVCVAPNSVIHNYDRRRNYSATTSDACYAYFFEGVENGLLQNLTKIPAMSLLLFECQENGFIVPELERPEQLVRTVEAKGQSLNWCSDWISFNSRDSVMLRKMQVYLFLGIEWISAAGLGLEKRPPTALMQRVNFVNRLLDMAVELVGGHAKYE